MAMSRKKRPETVDIASLQPTELNELKEVAREYLERRENIESEIVGLKESLKDLKDEFASRLDIKVLDQVIKVLKIEAKVERKGTYDALSEVLRDDYVNGLVD